MCEWIHLVRVSVITGVVCMAGMPCDAGEESAQTEQAATAERQATIEKMLRSETGDSTAVELWDASIPRESRADREGSWHSESAAVTSVAESLSAVKTGQPESGIALVGFVSADRSADNPRALVPTLAQPVTSDSAPTDATEPAEGDKMKSAVAADHALKPKRNTQPAIGDTAAGAGEPAWMVEAGPQTLDLGGLIARLLIATGVVLVLAVLAVLAVRKWMGPAFTPGVAKSSRLRLVETLALPQRASLQLVELDGRTVLVGMNAGGLQTITPVERPFSESLRIFDQDDETHAQDEVCEERKSDPVEVCDELNSQKEVAKTASSWTERIAKVLTLETVPNIERDMQAG